MKTIRILIITLGFLLSGGSIYAHCDSWDGPVAKDAMKALETNNVKLVFKWIIPEQESEITKIFNLTYKLRSGDKEVYAMAEQQFLETLVRLHRETEGAPYTGLKPSGNIKPIIGLSDDAIKSHKPEKLISALNQHIATVVQEKYDKVELLEKTKDASPEQGRAYVHAYVDYTHTVEALHDIIDGKHAHAEL
jgi:hypothetical protein